MNWFQRGYQDGFNFESPIWVILIVVSCVAAVGFLVLFFPDYNPDAYGRNMNCPGYVECPTTTTATQVTVP